MVHIHAIRLLGVAYVGILSFVISYLASHWLDKITPPLNEKKAKWKIYTVAGAIALALVAGAWAGTAVKPIVESRKLND